MEISKEEYHKALATIRAYEQQEKQKKLSIYEGCTKDDIFVSAYKELGSGVKCFAVFVTKERSMPKEEKAPEGIIRNSDDMFTLERSQTPYDSFEDAMKALLRTFKRKGYIK